MRELRRTVFSRSLLGLLAVLAALNCFLLAVEQRKTGFPARDYARVYAQEIAARQNETPEQALAALEALQEEDRRLLRAKLSAAGLTLLCIWLLYSLRQLWLISERCAPFSGLAAPANSLQCFSALPGWLPLWAASLGCLLLRLLAMGIAASVVLLISVWAGSQNQASLAAAAALLIPAALFAVGLESVRLLTPLELLAPLNWRLPLWPIWAGLSAAALVFTLRRWRRKL